MTTFLRYLCKVVVGCYATLVILWFLARKNK